MVIFVDSKKGMMINLQRLDYLNRFDSISLKDMERVTLMNRIDKKYWTDAVHFEELMHHLENEYLILEYQDERAVKYKTTYFDTPDDMLYMHHHEGKETRFKIRKRSYVKSGRHYLEIKYKTPDGRTNKERIASNDKHHSFNKEEIKFIEQTTQTFAKQFVPKLETKFYRVTLVNKFLPERVTIDLFPELKSKEGKLKLHNLVIIEVKNDGDNTKSFIIKLLEDNGIRRSGFSKYCIGRALLDPSLKQHGFEDKIIRLVERIKIEVLPEENLIVEKNTAEL